MFNARTISISLDHLVAEMVAYPFVSQESLCHPVEALSPMLDDDGGGATGILWRNAERYFVARFPHACLDELIALRNWTWFDSSSDEPKEIGLHHYLQRIAKSFFANRGGYAEPRLPLPEPGDPGWSPLQRPTDAESHDPAARRAWRWMTFAMPCDLLLAGLATDGMRPTRVKLLCPPVAALLQAGYAETHLHYGIALDFPTVWASAVHVVACAPDFRWNLFESPGAEHDEGTKLASWLVRAAIVRYLLGAFLIRRELKECRLEDFLGATKEENVAEMLRSYAWTGRQLESLKSALADLSCGQLSACDGSADNIRMSFNELQSAYNSLTAASTRKCPDSLDEAQSLDPLVNFFPNQGFLGPSVQLQFLWKGLTYLEQHPEDFYFSRLFWQVERVRGHVYRHCILRPLTPGLMNFIRFYDRKGKFTKPLEGITLESAGVLGGIGHGLRSLEVRTSPHLGGDRDEQIRSLRKLRKQWQDLRSGKLPSGHSLDGTSRSGGWRDAECGIVLHFLKFRGDRSDKGFPRAFEAENHADPAACRSASCFRWGQYFISQQKQARAIANATRYDAEPNDSAASILSFFRGIDVCRDEHGVPNWVIAPLFCLIREQIERVCDSYRERRGIELPPLRTTAHVGEDFVHLTTGLRYMDEALEYFPLGSGDRVGHGLALGVNPHDWASKFTRLAMPREDRWFDLIWERWWHAHPGARFTMDRRAFVEDEIVRLSRSIFLRPRSRFEAGDGLSPVDAVELRKLLFCWSSLESLGFPNQMLRRNPPTGLERFLERFLTEPSVYRNGRVVEWVQTHSEGDAIAELQRLVRKKYADTGITIEVNPISNLLVGDMTDLETHPLWRLAPGLRNDDGLTLRLCIGSDDPLPFATTLPDEYQFLYDSLVLAGRSHAEARSWLEEIRKMGWESRFTLP
jgi:hypothetical protein